MTIVAVVKKRKIVGRGDKTAGRGTKGQKSRKSGNVRLGFEGGQTPFYLRFPKRGFNGNKKKNNLKKNKFEIINLKEIERLSINNKGKDNNDYFDFSKNNKTVKILGDGLLKTPVFIRAFSFSKSSIEKINKSGGKFEIVSNLKKNK